MIIDSHSHVMLPIEKQLTIMEKEGINKIVLFSTSIHPEKAIDHVEYKNEIIRLNQIIRGEINPHEAKLKAIEELKSAVTAHPDKFVGAGYCPLNLSEKETEKYISENVIGNSFKGIGEIALAPGKVFSAENLIKAAGNFQNNPLWFHTFTPFTLQDIRDLLDFAKKYTDTTIILGHGGGSYWLDIIETVRELKNVYFDISASFTTHSIKTAAELIPERVLFSIDMPYSSPVIMKAMVKESVDDLSVQKLIFGENISNLLQI